MPAYTNFYENVKEAQMRLLHTVVLYDGQPYYVINISDHKGDGIFRIYLDPCGKPGGLAINKMPVPYETGGIPEHQAAFDEWLKKNPDSGIIRKMMNSPSFNRFRPFPLGMVNNVNGKGGTYYVERQPQRHTQQGLTNQMIFASPVALEPKSRMTGPVDIVGEEFSNTILGKYPSAHECVKALTNPETANESAAFHRNFAFVRGPIRTTFVQYKTDVIGVLPNNDLSEIVIPPKFAYTKQATEELGVFNKVTVR